VLLPAPSSLLQPPPYTLKFQNCPSVKKIKIENLFYLSSHSENKGVWSLVLGACCCCSRGDNGAYGGSGSVNHGGGASSVAVVVVFTTRILRSSF